MTRQEAIERWAQICNTVFWAEERISKEWHPRLKEAPNLSKEEQRKLADEYCHAIAVEVLTGTSDDDLAKMK